MPGCSLSSHPTTVASMFVLYGSEQRKQVPRATSQKDSVLITSVHDFEECGSAKPWGRQDGLHCGHRDIHTPTSNRLRGAAMMRSSGLIGTDCCQQRKVLRGLRRLNAPKYNSATTTVQRRSSSGGRIWYRRNKRGKHLHSPTPKRMISGGRSRMTR
jgi:hypothetical protein